MADLKEFFQKPFTTEEGPSILLDRLYTPPGEISLLKASPKTPFSEGVVAYINNDGYRHFPDENEAKVALKMGAAHKHIAFAVYSTDAMEIKVILQKKDNFNIPTTLLGAVGQVFDPEKLEDHLVEITHSAVKRNSYSAKLIPDIDGIDNGNSKIEKFVTENDQSTLISQVCEPISLGEYLTLEPTKMNKFVMAARGMGLNPDEILANSAEEVLPF